MPKQDSKIEEPTSLLATELLYKDKPTLNKANLLKRLKTRCPDIAPLDGKTDEGVLAFVHTEHTVDYSDKKGVPAQAIILPADKEILLKEYQEALSQTWFWKDAKDVVNKCKHSILVSDLLARGLPRKERLELFQKVLSAVVEETQPQAIAWKVSQQIVEPKKYLQAIAPGEQQNLLYGVLNVRLFRITNSKGDMLMDTLGLSSFGLPDLQCHFRKLDSTEVARVLFNTGAYLFGKGDVIEDGHTVQGVQPTDKWKCQHEMSLWTPKRIVIDMNPGPTYAAGTRK